MMTMEFVMEVNPKTVANSQVLKCLIYNDVRN